LFRFLLLVTLVAIGIVCIEPRWEPEKQALTLRMRKPDELSAVASEGARSFGSWLVRWWTNAQEAEDRLPTEELTRQDREQLDQLVKETTGEPEK
jgi:hypothetical protein